MSLIASRVFYGTVFDTQGTGANTLSDIMCRADDFKRSHEMDVSNKSITFNSLLRTSGVPGAASNKSPADLDGTG